MKTRRAARLSIVLGVAILGVALVFAGCSTGGSDPESPLPGTSSTLGATLPTPRVISPPSPSDARPTSTTSSSTSSNVVSPTDTSGGDTSNTGQLARTDSITYTVKRGDTLAGIAAQFPGISEADIVRANGIEDPNRIFAEQELIIPAP